MRTHKLLAELLKADVHLWIEDGQLRYRAPRGVVTPALRAQIIEDKEEIITLLQLQKSSPDVVSSVSTIPTIDPDLEQRYQPFPLNDIQQAYWLGRTGTFEVGNVSTHLYLEVDCPNLDLPRLNQALLVLIERHDMLRAIILSNGQQQILKSVIPYQIQVLDLHSQDAQNTESELTLIRQRMSHQVVVAEQWPLFEIRATHLEDGQTRLHFSIDGLIADGRSIFLLFQEWAELYHHPEIPLTKEAGEQGALSRGRKILEFPVKPHNLFMEDEKMYFETLRARNTTSASNAPPFIDGVSPLGPSPCPSASSLTPLTFSFQDYILAQIAHEKTEIAQSALNYWQSRLPTLPSAPQLPLAKQPSAITYPHFQRQSARLDPETWLCLKNRATQVGLTSSGILLAAYAEVLATWSSSQHFTLNVTLSNRLPFHPQVNELLGVFSSVNLLEVGTPREKQITEFNSPSIREDNFQTRAQRLQQQLWRDLEYHQINGVRVLRELARLRETGLRAQMPIVFTSMLLDLDQMAWLGEVVYSITQTPQVWLDCQTYERSGALIINWDAVEELFPPGMLQDMFQAYHLLLLRLADDEQSWQEVTPVPPEDYRLGSRGAGEQGSRGVGEQGSRGAGEQGFGSKQQLAINSQEGFVPEELLQTLFTSQVQQRPHQVAVVTTHRSLTYAELAQRSYQVGHKLRQLGSRPNTLVAVVMEKGWEQVVAVLGILQSGAAYLPIDPSLPQERLWYLLENSQVSLVLTQSWLNDSLELPGGVQRLCVDKEDFTGVEDSPLTPVQKSEDLAYVIYTSGSTGLPKGVMIAHRGAVNAIAYTNQRFSINASDRVLALTALHHDMSVYDIFGVLAAGGTIIISKASETRNPAHWVELIHREQVTLWNSVPAMMEMLVEYATGYQETLHSPSLQSLRLAFLGGDWIPLTLPHRLRSLVANIQIISVGGPTETTLWNIYYPIETVDPSWKSIPYGKPIANMRYYVLNEALDHCPVWVSGHLYCAGVGLAKGYWQNEEKTRTSFIQHPQTGERLYRTGDLGRYLPDGNIEFLGREDFQVKIGGFRIELGEIEAVLVKYPAVRGAVVTAVNEPSLGKNYLVAYVVLTQDRSKTDLVDELRSFLQQKLPTHMVPSAFMFLDHLPLTPNGKIDRRVLPNPHQGMIEPQATFQLPRNPVELVLVGIWMNLLGLERVSIHDNFFRIGGNSLLAVQLISQVRQAFEVELPLHYLFESSTIAELAQVLDNIRLAKSTTAFGMDVVLDLEAEAVLDPTIIPTEVPSPQDDAPTQIFLTGGTGFLGAFLLDELLKQTRADIYCLVRSSDAESGKKRLRENLESYSLWNEALSSRIIPVVGDLAEPLLGLGKLEFQRLASQIDSIYHNGALVNFTYPYQALKATNVLGTQEVLRLASEIKLKPVHFISTTTVFSASGYSDYEVISEQSTPEYTAGLHTGYTQSKWVAEKLVAIARSRGIPVSIYRPSFIAGHSHTGLANTEDFLVRMIKGCIQLGKVPEIDLAFNITPVDYVSSAIVHLSTQQILRSQTFHLVNPHHIAISWKEIVNWICDFGYPLDRMNYEQWQTGLKNLNELSLSNALYPLLPLFSQHNKSGTETAHNQLGIRQFDCRNTLNGLAETSLFCPPVNANQFGVYLSHFIHSGFLKSPASTTQILA